MSDRILVVGGGAYEDLAKPFGKTTQSLLHFFAEPESYKLIFFTGGEDVTPYLYGHRRCNQTYSNYFRDQIEQQIYESALAYNIKMVGVCRGLQWLTVMDGGFMIQHVDRHAIRGYHLAYSYGGRLTVNSLHHQMSVPRTNAYIIAVAPKMSNVYMVNGGADWKEGPPQEVESAYFPEIDAFGVQWHPEMMVEKAPGRQFFLEHLEQLLNGELEKNLIKAGCPIHEDLVKVGRIKYKKRYGRAIVRAKNRKEKDAKNIRDREIQT
jgi:anthranilate/para-aminobenzoate synthase component II